MDKHFLQYLKNSTHELIFFQKNIFDFIFFLYEKQLKWIDE